MLNAGNESNVVWVLKGFAVKYKYKKESDKFARQHYFQERN